MNSLFEFQFPDELTDWTILLYLVTSLAALWLAGFAYAKLRRINLADELAKKDNPALAISYAGFLTATALVISAVIQSPSHLEMNWMQELLDSLIWTGGAIVLLLLTLLVNDFVLFPRFKNRKEILEDRNVGLASVEAASFIATALVMGASLSEQLDPAELGEPWLTLLYFIIGQSMFLLYSKIYPKVAGLKLHQELEQDNPAIGVAFGGSLLAFAWLLSAAMKSYDSVFTVIFLAAIYVVALGLMRFAIRILFSGKLSLSHELQGDRNWGVGVLEGAISLMIASLLIASF